MKGLVQLAGLALAILVPAAANAVPVLLADGLLTGSSAGAGVDLSGLTAPLENGASGNILGGLGSGLAWAGGNTFVGLPDRGPNAIPFNGKIDDTASYISRLQTLTLALTPNTGAGLPFALAPTLDATTLLYSKTPLNYGTGAGLGNDINGNPIGSGAPAINAPNRFYFTGRSDNFGSGTSGNAADARLDPESIRVSNDGASVFVSDEYGPYIRQFDRATGALIKTFTLPANLDVANKSPMGATEISGNTVGRMANKGLEGLSITPDGTTLVGIVQANLEQDPTGLLHIVTVNVATGTTKEYGYKLTTGTGVSEIVGLNGHQFVVDERDGKGLGDGSNAAVKQLFVIDTADAADITGLSGAAAAAATLVAKSAQPLVNLVSLLGAAGIPPSQVPSKIEGLAFGQDVTFKGANYHTLYVANDNDFDVATSGQNRFFVVGLQDSDLASILVASDPVTFAQQQLAGAVPEPASWATMLVGLGLLGTVLRRRRAFKPALA